MNEAITIELQFFLVSILWGAITLVVYDVIRIVRRLIPHNSFFVALEDLIFWVATSVFIFAMIYTMNNGTIRGFSVMGMGIGMTLYHYIVSEIFVKWVSKAISLLLSPVKMLLGQIKRALTFLMSKIRKVARYLNRRLKKITKWVKITLNTHRSKKSEKRRKRKAAAKERYEKRSREKENKQSNRKRASKKRKKQTDQSQAKKGATTSDMPLGYIGKGSSGEGYRDRRLNRSGSIPVGYGRNKKK